MEPRARRRLWPTTLAGKAGVVALGAAVLLVAAWFAAMHYSTKRLQEAWALSKEFGLPVDFVELLGPVVPPERNAAVAYDRAAKKGATFILNLRVQRKVVNDEPVDDPSFLVAMDELLKDAEYEAALAEADRLTEYRSPVVALEPLFNISLAHLQTRRDDLRAERAIVRRLVSLGKREEAVRRLLRMSRLTRRWEEKEPLIISAMVNVAIREVITDELNLILRRGGPLPAVLHDEIEREMAEYETILRVMPRVGLSEAIAVSESYDMVSPLGDARLLRPLTNNDRAYLVRHLHHWSKTADRPYYEVNDELDAMDKEVNRIAGDPVRRLFYFGATATLRSISQARSTLDRAIAKARCLRIVNAWARRNDYAASLETLGLPKECLIDPFDGQRLRVKETPNGPIIYSIGQDLKDDGGRLEVMPGGGNGRDFGLGPAAAVEKK